MLSLQKSIILQKENSKLFDSGKGVGKKSCQLELIKISASEVDTSSLWLSIDFRDYISRNILSSFTFSTLPFSI